MTRYNQIDTNELPTNSTTRQKRNRQWRKRSRFRERHSAVAAKLSASIFFLELSFRRVDDARAVPLSFRCASCALVSVSNKSSSRMESHCGSKKYYRWFCSRSKLRQILVSPFVCKLSHVLLFMNMCASLTDCIIATSSSISEALNSF